MNHRRYGDLQQIWRKTSDRCHLCAEPVDLDTYGLVKLFGPETATVDHLVPQSWGGGDDQSNLLPAHHGCNSHRGTRDPDDVRYALSARLAPPMSQDARAMTVVGCGAVGGTLGALLSMKVDANGQVQVDPNAVVGGTALGLFVGLLLAA